MWCASITTRKVTFIWTCPSTTSIQIKFKFKFKFEFFFFKLLNDINLPCRICTRSMLSNIHNPTNMMLNRRIIAMPCLSFSRCPRIDWRFIFYYRKETRNYSPSTISTISWFIIPTIFIYTTIFSFLSVNTCYYLLTTYIYILYSDAKKIHI